MLELNVPEFSNDSVIDFSHLNYPQGHEDSNIISISGISAAGHKPPQLISIASPLASDYKQKFSTPAVNNPKRAKIAKTAINTASKSNNTKKSQLSSLFPGQNGEVLNLAGTNSSANMPATNAPISCAIDEIDFEFSNNDFNVDINAGNDVYNFNSATGHNSGPDNVNFFNNIAVGSDLAASEQLMFHKHDDVASSPFSQITQNQTISINDHNNNNNNNNGNSSSSSTSNNNNHLYGSVPSYIGSAKTNYINQDNIAFSAGNSPAATLKRTSMIDRFAQRKQSFAEEAEEDDDDEEEEEMYDLPILQHNINDFFVSRDNEHQHEIYQNDHQQRQQQLHLEGGVNFNFSLENPISQKSSDDSNEAHDHFAPAASEFNSSKAIPIRKPKAIVFNNKFSNSNNNQYNNSNTNDNGFSNNSNSLGFSVPESEHSLSYSSNTETFPYSGSATATTVGQSLSTTSPNFVKDENDLVSIPLSDELNFNYPVDTESAPVLYPVQRHQEENLRKRFSSSSFSAMNNYKNNQMSKRSKTIAMGSGNYNDCLFGSLSYRFSSTPPASQQQQQHQYYGARLVSSPVDISPTQSQNSQSSQFMYGTTLTSQQQTQQQLPNFARSSHVNSINVKQEQPAVLLNNVGTVSVLTEKRAKPNSATTISTTTTATTTSSNNVSGAGGGNLSGSTISKSYPPFQETIIDLSSSFHYSAKPTSAQFSSFSTLSSDFKTSSKNSKTILSGGVSITKLLGNSNGAIMTKAKLCNIGKKNHISTTFVCPHCSASFKVKGYLSRHLKKHSAFKAFVCPFYRSEEDLKQEEEAFAKNAEKKNGKNDSSGTNGDTAKRQFIGTKCHPSGGFSRRDTYKTHLKALHFIYPAGTKSTERNDVGGRCAGCFEYFDNNNSWLEEHIEKGECEVIVRNNVINAGATTDAVEADTVDVTGSTTGESVGNSGISDDGDSDD